MLFIPCFVCVPVTGLVATVTVRQRQSSFACATECNKLAWVEKRIEYHCTHWKSFETVFTKHYVEKAERTSNMAVDERTERASLCCLLVLDTVTSTQTAHSSGYSPVSETDERTTKILGLNLFGYDTGVEYETFVNSVYVRRPQESQTPTAHALREHTLSSPGPLDWPRVHCPRCSLMQPSCSISSLQSTW